MQFGVILVLVAIRYKSLPFFVIGTLMIAQSNTIGINAVFGICKAFSVEVSKSLGYGIGAGSMLGTILVLVIENLSVNYLYSLLVSLLMIILYPLIVDTY